MHGGPLSLYSDPKTPPPAAEQRNGLPANEQPPLPIFTGLAGCSVLVGIWATLTGGIFHALSTPGSPPPRSCWGLTSPRNQFFAGQAALLLAAGLFFLVTQQVGAFLVVVECVVVE